MLIKATIEVSKLLYEGMKKVGRKKNVRVGKVIQVALIKYLSSHKDVFSIFELKEFEEMEKKGE